MSDFNQKIIAEFRENDGKVGGYFANTTILLLHTTGAKSGQARINPVATFLDDETDRYVIIASKGGAPDNPDWYYNLVANPEVDVEVGTEEFKAKAIVTDEPERSELYTRMAKINPGFLEYEKNTDRVIPVIALERI